jgi:antirestriction protein ArdC
VRGLPERFTQLAPPRFGNSGERDEWAEGFIRCTRAKLVEDEKLQRACYIPQHDVIAIPDFRAFKSSDDYYAAVFHELGHWTGHPSRLARDLSKRFNRHVAAEELVAELCAAFLCAEFEFDGDIRSAGYIEHWIELLKDDRKAFFTAASAAQKAADYLRELALKEPCEEAA